MKKEGQTFSVLGLLAALIIAVVAACANDQAPAPVPAGNSIGNGIHVQQSWSVARAVSGHHTHVLRQKIGCANCHALSEDSMGPVTPERCAACHAREAQLEHARPAAEQRFGAGTKAECTACHAFTLEATEQEQEVLLAAARPLRTDAGARALPPEIPAYEASDCQRCHTLDQDTLDQEHVPEAAIRSRADQEHAPGVRVHATQPCLVCHQPHQHPTPQSAPCSDCHKDIHTTHAAQGKGPNEVCQACHEHQHAPAVEALGSCVECHATHEPVVPASATFANGHAQCTSCHRPHGFEQEAAQPCKTCHERVQVLAATRVKAHNDCTNCHSPHDVQGAPAAACASCHKDVHSDHPAARLGRTDQGRTDEQRAGGCIGCHDPHPDAARPGSPGARKEGAQKEMAALGAAARTCTSCHQDLGPEHGGHGNVACTGCHQPHHFALELTNVASCAACHGEQVQHVSVNPGHAACANCHAGLPHHPEALEKGCDTCHRQEQQRVNKGHARCNECHEPHSGAQAQPCASCHAVEAQTAPRGHQACTGCHEPHAGTELLQTCGACHAEEAASPHGKLGTGCLTCHRPHGPEGPAQVPACSSCHALAELPGLHREVKHQTCTNCHSGHDELPSNTRQSCLSCHRERTDHFPDGRCANCHLFAPTR